MASSAEEQVDGFAVVVLRGEDGWQVGRLPSRTLEELDDLVAAVRQQPPHLGAFVLADVADEFFVVVRQQDGVLRLLLSDVTAASEWELAEQVLDALELDLSDDELDEVRPAGDLGVFSDLGLDERELGSVLSDVDAYADEQLSVLARRLGFAEAYERVVDALTG